MIIVFAFHRSAQNDQISPFNEIFLKKISSSHQIIVISVRHFSPHRKLVYVEDFGTYKVVEFSGYMMPEKHNNLFLRKLNKFMAGVMYSRIVKMKLLLNPGLVHQIGFFHPIGLYFANLCKLPFLMQVIGNDKYLINNWSIDYPGNIVVTANSISLAKSIQSKFLNPHVIYRGVDAGIHKHCVPGSNRYKTIFFGGGFPDYDDKPDGRRYNFKGGLSLLDVFKETNSFNLNVAGPNCEVGKKYSTENKIFGINFLGYLSHPDLLAAIINADIVVIPSLDEGLANVAMEGMLAAKLLISRAVGGMPELIQNGENGLLFNTDAELKKLLNEIGYSRDLGEVNKYDEMRNKARLRVLKSFNNDTMVTEYSKLYDHYESSKIEA